ITHAARASQSKKEQADKDMVATQEKEKAAKQQQEQQEQLLNQQRQQLQTLQNQINDADEQLKQRKLQRVKEAQQEVDRNNLMYGDNEPITADNINDVEASIDQWRNDQRQQWQTDQTKHTKLIN
ncbi:replication protein, partial [Lactobacillus sp. UMNPBX1]